MKKLYFKNEKATEIIKLFEMNTKAKEIEISIDGNEFSVWKNDNGISILLQDTTEDEVGLLTELEANADFIEEY